MGFSPRAAGRGLETIDIAMAASGDQDGRAGGVEGRYSFFFCFPAGGLIIRCFRDHHRELVPSFPPTANTERLQTLFCPTSCSTTRRLLLIPSWPPKTPFILSSTTTFGRLGYFTAYRHHFRLWQPGARRSRFLFLVNSTRLSIEGFF